MHELPPPAQLFKLATGKMITKPLYLAAKFAIADHLADGPKHVDQLAAAAGLHAPSLYRLLRTLASVGVFQEDGEHRFQNTATSELLKSGPTLRAMVLWLNDPRHDRAWENLEHTLQTGQPCVETTYGKPVFEWLPTVPDLAAIFHQAMAGNSATMHAAVIDAYDFAGISTLVDVGGGHGSLLLRILQRHPQMKGIVFDAPHVVDGAKKAIAEAGLTARCEAAGGDFFHAVPDADAQIMSFILHDWDDARSLALLKNCRAKKLLVVELVVAEGNAPSFGKIIDMEMLAFTGGIERTEKEYRALLQQAGYRLERVIPTHSPCSLLEAARI
jgi:hypothetical protein